MTNPNLRESRFELPLICDRPLKRDKSARRSKCPAGRSPCSYPKTSRRYQSFATIWQLQMLRCTSAATPKNVKTAHFRPDCKLSSALILSQKVKVNNFASLFPDKSSSNLKASARDSPQSSPPDGDFQNAAPHQTQQIHLIIVIMDRFSLDRRLREAEIVAAVHLVNIGRVF